MTTMNFIIFPTQTHPVSVFSTPRNSNPFIKVRYLES